MGKVDQGGGGTIAKFMADRNIDTIDAGVPVLSMHAPFELVAKFDCWMTYRGVLAAYCDTQACPNAAGENGGSDRFPL